MIKKTAAISALWLLSACTASHFPEPETLPDMQAAQGRWFQLEERDAGGTLRQSSLLAIEQTKDEIRFVQTDALGSPLSRQVLGKKGWRNDGFVMPNATSRRLFGAMLPIFNARDLGIYPDLARKATPNGECFRQNNKDLWCTEKHGQGWLITFPGQSRWLVTPIQE